MEHKASLTISRPHYGDGKRKIKISVKDRDARIHFLDLEIDLDAFAECITGLSECDCKMEFRNLEGVGKKIEKMGIEFEIPGPKYTVSNAQIKKLAKENTPDGWRCSMYFGSKSSFYEKDGVHFAKTDASRWVEKE